MRGIIIPFKERVRFLIGTHRVPYFMIFKVVLPFLMSMLQIDYLSSIMSLYMLSKGAYVRDYTLTVISYFAFFTFLLLLPKFASFIEFVIHPAFFIAIFRYGFFNPTLAYLSMGTSILLILTKIYFYFAFILDDELHKKENYDDANLF